MLVKTAGRRLQYITKIFGAAESIQRKAGIEIGSIDQNLLEAAYYSNVLCFHFFKNVPCQCDMAGLQHNSAQLHGFNQVKHPAERDLAPEPWFT